MKNGEFFLSVIIPCYNMELYLQSCIGSLKKLDDSEDVEFIFVNDGSDDGTFDIITSYVNEESRAVLINQKNQGVSAARNRALEIARGRYILCLDPDDYLAEDAVTVIKKSVNAADLLIPNVTRVYDDFEKVSYHNIPEGLYSIDDLFSACKIFPIAPKLVYKREIIDLNGVRFNEKVKCGEVIDFTISFLKYASAISVISSSFYCYRLGRIGQMTRTPNFPVDVTVLNSLENYYGNNFSFSYMPSYLIIPFSISLSFTYKKYIRLGLCCKEVFDTIEKVLSNKLFIYYRNRIILSKGVSLRHRLRALYLLMPFHKVNYLAAMYAYKLLSMARLCTGSNRIK